MPIIPKEFFIDYYYTRKLSFHKMSKASSYSIGSLHRNFHKLGLKPIKQEKAWNSGKSYKDDSRILAGEKHPRWENKSKYLIDFKRIRKEILSKKPKCNTCKNPAYLIHHKDRNTRNNSLKNLIPLCSSCHTTLHNKARDSYKNLLRARGIMVL